MLKSLTIKNMAIVSRVEVPFGPGLNLLTGETGAGKSILVDALGLLLGSRASAELVRSGERAAWVEGTFEGEELDALIEKLALPEGEDGVTVVRREVAVAGKSRATVNGAQVQVSQLRLMAPLLAEIHGQNDSRDLLDPAVHARLLDAFGESSALAQEVGGLAREAREADRQLRKLHSERQAIEQRRDMLRFQLHEIDQASLRPDEEDALRQEKVVVANAGRLAQLTDEAYTLLYEDEASVLDRLARVYRRIEEMSGVDARLASHLDARPIVRAHLDELALALRSYREGLDVSPGRLDSIEDRLSLIERLKRKYGPSIADVLAHADKSRDELEALDSTDEREKELRSRLAQIGERYAEKAARLSTLRRKAAKLLGRRMGEELGLLAMRGARFEVALQATVGPGDIAGSAGEAAAEQGLETVEFLFSANPGEDLRPLAAVASGGELSRTLLALKSLVHADGSTKTLVFDEVDAGIGGGVAEVVGRKLRALSRSQQVLCVTHLPQIAAQADHHLRVQKLSGTTRTTTVIAPLEGEERIEEIARMLGGETVGESARLNAKELIDSVR